MLASGAYSRPRVSFSSQAEYPTIALARFLQSALTTSVLVSLVVTSAHLGSTPPTWQIAVPDFSGASGFDNAWMLRPGMSTQYLIEAFGGPNTLIFGGVPTDGDSYRFAYRQSSATTSARMRRDAVVLRRPLLSQYLSR